MGRPQAPLPVKCVVGMIARDASRFQEAATALSRKLGKTDFASPVWDFCHTDYYEKEMGRDLKRRFVSFEALMPPERLTAIKLFTNGLEKKLSRGSLQRALNLDPGYVSLSKLVLATTKNFSHRVYVKDGIFEEITLTFEEGSYRPGRWTYPDYRTQDYIGFFNMLREEYRRQIEEKYGLVKAYRCV